MPVFDPPIQLTVAFALLTLLVAVADILLVRRAAPEAGRGKWTLYAVLAAAVWLALHAGLAESGVLEGDSFPPPAMPYFAVNVLIAVGVVWSPVGRRLSALPLYMLVGLQFFRLPLEILLHELYGAGQLPVQMTWSGYNFDVMTAVLAIPLAVYLALRGPQKQLVWAWNILGSLLLLTVVTIALLSAPLPIRQFMNDPPVVLVFHAPYNWIVNVHVWTALVGHLIIFRALMRTPDAS